MGFGYIPSDRHRDGLLMRMDLEDNYLLFAYSRKEILKNGLLNKEKIRQNTENLVEEFNIKTPGLDAPIGFLSGGNQQKMILARELSDDPKCIIASQPTRGLDVGATEFIHEQLMKYRDMGCSILLISTDMEEILECSDEISVLYKGEIMGTMENDSQVSITEIGQMMAGSMDKERMV